MPSIRSKIDASVAADPGDFPQRVVWRFSDGRPGHDTQSRGLVEALAKRLPLKSIDVPAPYSISNYLRLLGGKAPAGCPARAPDLLVGAGHGTHAPMLATRATLGGRCVVLMKPSLPLAWFDLCVVPEHDGVEANNCLVTRGPLNSVNKPEKLSPDDGLILIGGPSKHHAWDEGLLLDQLTHILKQDFVQWVVTTSARTPPSTRELLSQLQHSHVNYVPAEDCKPGQLHDWLAQCGTTWVTTDSMSMMYEALSTGAAVGVIETPAREKSRLSGVASNLGETGMLTLYSEWRKGKTLVPPVTPLAEADRCAAEIIRRLGWNEWPQ